MKLNGFVLIIVFTVASALGQGWVKTYTIFDINYVYDLEVVDGGYALLGDGVHDGSITSWLLITDEMGDSVSLWTYPDTCIMLRNMTVCKDGSLLLVGMERILYTDVNAIAMKISLSGDTLWSVTYSTDRYDRFDGVIELADSSLLFWGIINEQPCILKTDSLGGLLWYNDSLGLTTQIRSLIQLPNGDFGFTGRYPGFDLSGYVNIGKTDSLGNLIWENDYGICGQSCIINIGDTLVTAWNCEYLFGFIALNTDSSYCWDYIFYNMYHHTGYSPDMILLEDNSYVVCAISDTNYYLRDVYLAKFVGNAELVWSREYNVLGLEGFYLNVRSTRDGGFVMSGLTGVSDGPAGQSIFLIKTDSLGYTDIEEPLIDKPEQIQVSAYPNPFNSAVKIDFSGIGHNYINSMRIFNIKGKIIYSKTINKRDNSFILWEPSVADVSGVYFIELQNGNNSFTIKALYLK